MENSNASYRKAKEEKSSYYAVIPANVRYSDIIPNAKLLYGEITALCNKQGYCWASNTYFSELYQVHPDTISQWIKQLADNKFIEVDYGKQRKIILLVKTPVRRKHRGGQAKTPEGVGENLGHNNTINNTNNISSAKAEGAFSFKEEIKKLEDSPRRDLNIIAFYLDYKGIKFENQAQLNTAIRRHIKAAGQLKAFSDAQLLAGAKKAHEQYKELWTLETLTKILTR